MVEHLKVSPKGRLRHSLGARPVCGGDDGVCGCVHRGGQRRNGGTVAGGSCGGTGADDSRRGDVCGEHCERGKAEIMASNSTRGPDADGVAGKSGGGGGGDPTCILFTGGACCDVVMASFMGASAAQPCCVCQLSATPYILF